MLEGDIGTTVEKQIAHFNKPVRKCASEAPRPGARAALNLDPGQKHDQSGRVM